MALAHKLAVSVILLLLLGVLATPRALADAAFVPLDGSQPDVRPSDFGYQIETRAAGGRVTIDFVLSPAAAKSFGHADLILAKSGGTVVEATLGLDRDPDQDGRMRLTFDPQVIDGGELIIWSGHIEGEPVSPTSTIRNFGGFRLSIATLLAMAAKEAAADEPGEHESQQAEMLPNYPLAISPAGLPVGRWEIEFANDVVETCEIRSDGTAAVAEPKRNSGGRVEIAEGAVVITFDDDRVERWTPVGHRMVVEHWYPAGSFPRATPVLGIADRALTDEGARVGSNDCLSTVPIDDRRQAFFKAIAEGRFDDVAEAIKAEPQLTNAKYQYGGKPLFWAAFQGHEKITALLLEQGAEIDARGIQSATPLYEAVYRGHADTVKLLLKHNPDIEAANERGDTPLYAAVSRGHQEVVESLLEAGANPNGPPIERGSPIDLTPGAASPLLLAVSSATRPIGGLELTRESEQRQKERRQEARRIAEILIVHPKAEINQFLMGQRAPLHMTAAAGDFELTRLLLEHGADPNVQDRPPPSRRLREPYFSTPLHHAASAGHAELMEVLEQHGAEPSIRNSLGQTPGDLLQEKGRKEVLEP